MGCFSFLCKECNKATLSDSFRGEQVRLYLLKDGKVIEELQGEYDSYGRIFNKDFTDSVKWKIGWSAVCDLMFHPNKGHGIAAIHEKCYKEEKPITRSQDDPNQGWGDGDDADLKQAISKDSKKCNAMFTKIESNERKPK